MNYQFNYENLLDTNSIYYPQKINTFVKNKAPIFYEGDLTLADRPAVAIVGTRRCTKYGLAVTKEIAKRAAAYDIVVVSGLARGIDTAAHRTVLEEGGKTVGVIGCGIDMVYPAENKDLYKAVKKEGLMISEYPPGTPPRPSNFPSRNRIISALSEVVVVVEAGTRSGALITAECAVEQGKDVFAVPGNISNVYSMGPNKLIRDGAKALVIIDDVFAEIGRITKKHKLPRVKSRNDIINSRKNGLGSDEIDLLNIISGSGEVPIYELCERTNKSMAEINGIITILEMKGLIYFEMGKVSIANFT